ncbi:hypothetical protein [Burkholderia multivorans]|uniref:hypothetical protein n=1 Tax=Burkholderia multivorans TaxID=87883 RepID=UPI001C26621B|nr:hypothetical protein [Burkholderia multivorans]MBU9542852.1 hypothetical protein [Burkholderia multivorans]
MTTELYTKRLIDNKMLENGLNSMGYICDIGGEENGRRKLYVYTFENYSKIDKINNPRLASFVISFFYRYKKYPLNETTYLENVNNAMKQVLLLIREQEMKEWADDLPMSLRPDQVD